MYTTNNSSDRRDEDQRLAYSDRSSSGYISNDQTIASTSSASLTTASVSSWLAPDKAAIYTPIINLLGNQQPHQLGE